MSLDRSLKFGSGLAKHRNVLTRPERVARLADRDKFDLESGDPLHLPKVANRKVATAKSSKKKETAEGAEATVGAAAPAGGAAAAGAGAAGGAAGGAAKSKGAAGGAAGGAAKGKGAADKGGKGKK